MRFGTKHGAYDLTPLPGSPQVVVSHGSFVDESHRGEGLGKAAHKERLAKIAELGYDLAICTVVATNKAELRILNLNKWHHIWDFRSSASGHMVQVWAKNILHNGEVPVYDEII